MKNKRLLGILVTVICLLLIPFVAMQFTNEVNWNLFDFIVAGILLLAFGLAFDFVITKVKITKHRIAICTSIFAVFILIWMELAVGIFGTPLAGT